MESLSDLKALLDKISQWRWLTFSYINRDNDVRALLFGQFCASIVLNFDDDKKPTSVYSIEVPTFLKRTIFSPKIGVALLKHLKKKGYLKKMYSECRVIGSASLFISQSTDKNGQTIVHREIIRSGKKPKVAPGKKKRISKRKARQEAIETEVEIRIHERNERDRSRIEEDSFRVATPTRVPPPFG